MFLTVHIGRSLLCHGYKLWYFNLLDTIS
uniref:Uncharacterized protein n=1 Tax=Arundo donax TaxID=35708 RepID=A0A0A9SMT5_ARUDO